MEVRLLGPVDVRVDGAPRPVRGRRRTSLLAALALHPGEVVSADRLIDIIWDDDPPANAAITLQSHVSHLRHALGDRTVIPARSAGYLLATGAQPTDVQTAEHLIEQAVQATEPADAAAGLQTAVALWRGQPLAGLTDLSWFNEQAQRLEQLLLQARHLLVDARLALNQHQQLIPELEHLCRQHPFREPIHGQLMVALYRAGRQGDALAVYQRLRNSLGEDLGIGPSQPLRDLEIAVLRQDPALDPPPSPPPGSPSPALGAAGGAPHARVLLEREEALDTLRRCPPGTVALIAGEAGVGKTSVVGVFGATLGRPVWSGACDALMTPRPLGPFRDIARQAGGELARVMAEGGPRHAVFQTVLDRLAERATVVVVEDAHWADEATIDLLVFLGRRLATTTSQLMVTFRDDEIGVDHRLRRFLGAVATDPTVRRIRLEPLSLRAVGALARSSAVDPAELHARTGGNPFFVTEALADPGPTVPATVRDAVLARAAALTESQRHALESVAIFPQYAELRSVHAPPEAVDACVRTGMLTTDGVRIRFRHEIARLTIAENTPAQRRVALHTRVLSDPHLRRGEPAQLAYHAEQAGNERAVLHHASRAARRAALMGAHRQAVDHYAQTLRLAGVLSEHQRAELLELYAEECARVERDDDAVLASGQALQYWRHHRDQERHAALLARRSNYLATVGRHREAEDSARAALALAGRLTPGRGLVAAYTWSAVLLMFTNDNPGALAAGERAVALADQFDELALQARALNAVGMAHRFTAPDVAEQTMVRSLELARRAGDDTVIGVTMVNLGVGPAEARQYPTAERWLRETIDWCTRHDMDGYRSYANAWLARVQFERGDWRQAVDTIETAPPPNRLPARIVVATVLGRIQARRGDPGAEQTLEEAWALASQTGQLQRLWPAAAGLAELAWLRDEPVARSLRDTYELAVRMNHPWAIGELGQWLDPVPDAAQAAAPYRLPPAERAQAWYSIGCPYEAAAALSESPQHLPEARARFEGLGARPIADRLT